MSENNEHKEAMKPALILAAVLSVTAGLCALALHPAVYPSDATDTGDLEC